MARRVYIETPMESDDEGVRAVRDIRKRISAQLDHDPQELVEHYMAEQEKYRDRLLHRARKTGS